MLFFHADELQNSYGQLEQLVASWWPTNERAAVLSTRDEDVAIPRGRPERLVAHLRVLDRLADTSTLRLGLGASLAKSQYAANSRIDTAETKKLKQLMGANGNKRRRSEEPESALASSKGGPSTDAPSDDEEDSRAKAFSSKKAKNAGPVFHDKPAKKPVTPSLKKDRKEAQVEDAFAVPAVPTKSTEGKKVAGRSRSSTPQNSMQQATNGKSPTRLINVKPPFALPTSSGNGDLEEGENEQQEEEEDDTESVTTETTQSTLLDTPMGSPNGKPKRKRKKKKKKKKAQVEGESGSAAASGAAGESENLFGTSTTS